jgi:hypothetical protein
LLAAAVAAAVLIVAAPAGAAARDRLDAYTAIVDARGLAAVTAAGFDLEGAKKVRGGTEVDLIMTAEQRDKLAAEGVNARLTRVQGGLTVQQFAARQALSGFNVWRSWDEPGGLRDELRETARENPRLTKLVRLGTTLNGREILALKVTKDARWVRDGKRDAVLFSSTQHAREWITPEVNRRLMHYYIDRYNSGNRHVRDLLEETELWFVLVANPDGYQYTFDGERLWRKNLRDNNGDGEVNIGDGVDPNRNWPAHWSTTRRARPRSSRARPTAGRAPTPSARPWP